MASKLGIYPLVLVKWQDMTTYEETNTPLSEPLMVFQTSGFLLKDGKHVVRVASTIGFDGEEVFKDVTLIPKSVVLSIKSIKQEEL